MIVHTYCDTIFSQKKPKDAHEYHSIVFDLVRSNKISAVSIVELTISPLTIGSMDL